MIAYKYRIYPTKKQKRLLERTLEGCRYVYNKTLALRKESWENEQTSLSYFDTNKALLIWKAQEPFLKEIRAQALQETQKRVDLAFRNFFRRVKNGETPGYPRFKSKGRYTSFTYPQDGGFTIQEDKKQIRLSKIGAIKTVFSRPIQGIAKTCTVIKTPTDKWFVVFTCEVKSKPQLLPTIKSVGIDVGLTTFATLSTGELIENPRFFRQEEKNLAKAQRNLSKTAKDTLERIRQRKVVARIHERITNQRSNFAHQLSRRLVNTYSSIYFEDLNIRGMLRNHRLAKSIQDAAWNQLITYTTYKAAEAGRCVKLVPSYNTTQRCSQCGEIVIKGLGQRVHKCPYCELKIDRDLNAALNILTLGMQSLGTCTQEAHQ